MTQFDLDRFVTAQERDYSRALAEIKAGRKTSHWMWYIFPQVQGLGFSSTSQHYAVSGLAEAKAYLDHPLLGMRLREITATLLQLPQTSAHAIFGSPDDLKLRSCMTLFAQAESSQDNLFKKVLDKYFKGAPDAKTITALRSKI